MRNILIIIALLTIVFNCAVPESSNKNETSSINITATTENVNSDSETPDSTVIDSETTDNTTDSNDTVEGNNENDKNGQKCKSHYLLKSLIFSEGILEPDFSSEVFVYKLFLEKEIEEIEITPEAYKKSAIIKINNNCIKSSKTLKLNIGEIDQIIVESFSKNGKIEYKYVIQIIRSQNNGEEWQKQMPYNELGKVYDMKYYNNSLFVAADKLNKFDLNGNKIWTKSFYGNAVGGILIDENGYIYSTGGYPDITVAKYDPDGNVIWSENIGTSTFDCAYAIALDKYNNVYISGYSTGKLTEDSSLEQKNFFVIKFSTSGSKEWTKIFSHDISSEYVKDMKIDSNGNIYITGRTNDAYLIKLDANGNVIWDIKLEGYNELGDISFGVDIDKNNNIYLCGTTHAISKNNYGSELNSFIAKYDVSGNMQWIKIDAGGKGNEARDVVCDDRNNIYITAEKSEYYQEDGTTKFQSDAVVSKFDSNGNIIFKKLYGTPFMDSAVVVAADNCGNAYTAGNTYELPGGSVVYHYTYIAKFSE